MRIVRDLRGAKPRPSCVTFGVFDGVHLGHQALLRRTVELARQQGLRSVALTFDPIPEVVLRGVRVPLLTTNPEKAALIRQAGIDLLAIARFDRAFASITPLRFIREVLVGWLGARIVVAGPRTRFGHFARGDLRLLKQEGKRLALQVEEVREVAHGGLQMSSSMARQLLAMGRVALVRGHLGRPYSVTGRVVPGAGRGRKIGFPTANLRIRPEKMLPPDGVYAACAVIGDERLPAAVNIGTRPTFARGRPAVRVVEAHVLSYPARPACDDPPVRRPADGRRERSRRPSPELAEGASCPDLLGRAITLELLRRLRSERRFASVEALREQIVRDCARTLKHFPRAYSYAPTQGKPLPLYNGVGG
jgi:riboflavin kinase/FMN adenylyltransferase